MDNLLIGGGLILFLIGIVMLILALVKKTKKKSALLLILVGFIVWIIGGAFVDTETTPEAPSAETELVKTEDAQKENQVENNSEESAQDDTLIPELFSNSFDSFYEEITSMTTANIDNYVNNGLNKQVVWSGKVIDVYSDYAYIECIDSLSTDSAISTFCNVYAPANTLQELKKDQQVMFTGVFAGANARSYTGCSWIIKNAVVTPDAN